MVLDCSSYCTEGVHVFRAMVRPTYTDAQVTQLWSLALGPLFVRWTDALAADLTEWIQLSGWTVPVDAADHSRLCLVWAQGTEHDIPYTQAEMAERIQEATILLSAGREVV